MDAPPEPSGPCQPGPESSPSSGPPSSEPTAIRSVGPAAVEGSLLTAEVIAVGDELTCGQRLDTNSKWLSAQLARLGIPTRFHTTVGDALPDLVRVFRTAAARVPLVIITGGLGPTADDLTRQGLAQALARPLELDEPSLEAIRQRFRRRLRKMAPSNRVQAMFPRGARVIENPHGTAPGIDLSVDPTDLQETLTASRSGVADHPSTRVFALPGVPAEMRQMWDATVAPALRAMQPGQCVIEQCSVRCFGAGESELEGMLPDLIRRGREPQVGITVHEATITLRVTASGTDRDACLAKMEPTLQTIHERLGSLVFGTGDVELQDALVRLLARRDERLVVIDWRGTGLVVRWLSEADDPRDPRVPIAVRLADPCAAQAVLGQGVSDGTIELPKLLESLARRARERFSADWALVTGPVPEVREGTSAADTASFLFCVASADGVDVVAKPFVGHPDILVPRAVKQALNDLRLRFLADDGSDRLAAL